MTTDFCAGVVGDEQYVGAVRVGRRIAKLVAPQTHFAPAAQFPCNQADRLGILARLAIKLEVNRPNLAEGESGEYRVRVPDRTALGGCRRPIRKRIGDRGLQIHRIWYIALR